MDRRSCLLLAFPASLSGASPLAGRWRSVTTTRGGIGAVYEFRSNGRATYSSVALVDMEYQLAGNQLTLGGQAVGVGWHADGRMQLNFGQGQVEDFTRQGKVTEATQPLLGEWKGRREMAGRRAPVSLQFHANRRAVMAVFLKSVAGQYLVTGDGWTLTLPGLPSRRITAEPEQLVIQAVNGDPHRFARL